MLLIDCEFTYQQNVNIKKMSRVKFKTDFVKNDE